MYADDIKICKEMSDTLDGIKLQADLNNMLQKWSEQWQLKFNSVKCSHALGICEWSTKV